MRARAEAVICECRLMGIDEGHPIAGGIAILLLFSFNDSVLPSFPLSGFTLTWYRQFIHDPELRGALETSAIVATLSSVGAVVLGTFASIPLARRRFTGKGAVSALLLSPLVVPYVVLGISLLLLFHAVGVPRTILTVVGIVVAITAFGLLRTIVDAWYAGANASSSASRKSRYSGWGALPIAMSSIALKTRSSD